MDVDCWMIPAFSMVENSALAEANFAESRHQGFVLQTQDDQAESEDDGGSGGKV